MNSELQELKVMGVYKEGMKKDNSFPRAYQYPFKLSGHPDNLWVEIFEYVYKHNIWSSMKRRAYVSGDCIVVILADTDNKTDQKRNVEQAVEQTNEEYKRIRQEQRKQEEQRKKSLKEYEETIEKLKKEAKDV